jgi:DNA-binding NarL/FixJ family response regulator
MNMRIAIFEYNKSILNDMMLLLNNDPAFEIAGTFSNMKDCVEHVITSRPYLILMDIENPGMDGIEVIKLLKNEFPHIQILIQTAFEDDKHIFDSICAGVSGYILKKHLNKALITAIKELQKGGSPMSPSIARRVMVMVQENYRSKHQSSDQYKLTHREKEVLTCLVNGLSYKMIALDLCIAYDTVRSHVKNIYEKLQVGSLTELICKALKENIV